MTTRRFSSAYQTECSASLAWGLATLLVVVLAPRAPHAQVCTGDVTLSTQAQVDGFNCNEVAGHLLINGPDITNLDGLSSLASISGYLSIVNNAVLTSLAGLSAVTNVEALEIRQNSVLTNMDGLSSLTSVTSFVFVSGNPALTNMDGLSSLTSIRYFLEINNNRLLGNVDGLSALTSVGGNLRLVNNGFGAAGISCCGLFPLLKGSGVAGEVTFTNNGDGCNSVQGILDGGACTTAVDETTWGNLKRRYR